MEKFNDKGWVPQRCITGFKGLEVEDQDELGVTLPSEVFADLILTHRREYAHLLPMQVTILDIDSVETEWTKGSSYLGVVDFEKSYNGSLDLYLRRDKLYTNQCLLWILLHEFRHIIQYDNDNVGSCVHNDNELQFMQWARQGSDDNTVNHVLHEILPMEVDANTFACELLRIEYPGSKFDMTEERLAQLGTLSKSSTTKEDNMLSSNTLEILREAKDIGKLLMELEGDYKSRVIGQHTIRDSLMRYKEQIQDYIYNLGDH